jgi:hypothetical protein
MGTVLVTGQGFQADWVLGNLYDFAHFSSGIANLSVCE